MFAINVEPKQIFVDEAMPKITSLECWISDFIPNEKAVFGVKEILENGTSPIETKLVTLEGEAYQSWSEDLPFLQNFICNKLGYSYTD